MSIWPLTGRDPERAVIEDEFAAGSEHRGVAIVGPAGVGKTRLAREAAAAASQRGWAIREVFGTIAARSIPMGAFAQWTDGLTANPLHLVRSVIDQITTMPTDKPVLLVVDDAHLLDDISAFTLLQLVLRGVVHVVATIRSGEPSPDAITALWKDRHLARLDLKPLSRNETDLLVGSVLGGPLAAESAERIWKFSRGNVLFLQQLIDYEIDAGRLRHLDRRWVWEGPTGLPPSLIDIIERQFGTVRDTVIDVVDLVAVGEPLELSNLIKLTDPDTVEEAEQLGLISISAETDALVYMAHPLFGELRRTHSGPLRLKHLRGRIAEAITPPNPLHADAIRLGLLWLNSDLPPNRDVFTAAAWAAILRLDLTVTEMLAAAAIRAGAGIDAQLLRARMLILLNKGADAEELLEAIPADGLSDPLRATVLQLRAANLLWIQSRPEASWTLIEEALAVESGTVAEASLIFRAVQLATAGRPNDALAIVDGIDRSQLPALSAMLAIWALTIACGDIGHADRAVNFAEQGAALAAVAPEISYETVNLACFEVVALTLAGRLSQARSVAEHTLHQHADTPGVTRSVATAIAGMAALYGGDLRAALDHLDSAVRDFGNHGGGDGTSYQSNGMSYQFLILHAEALARAGDSLAAKKALTVMQEHRPRSWEYIESDYLLASAWVAVSDCDVAAAQGLAQQAVRFAREHQQYAREVLALQTALQFGDTDPTCADRLHYLATVVEGPRATLSARWATARDCADGDGLLVVSHELEAIGDHIAAADAAGHAASAFDSGDRRAAALAAGIRATRISTACGAVTPATRAVTTPPELSAREREIADLVADGLSNRQIADLLTVSARTIEGYVYRACVRLGIRGRAELTDVMAEYPRHALADPGVRR